MTHLDVVMDDGGVDVDVYGVGYTAGQVESAIAGATITPAQLGTADNPVDETHVTTANHEVTNTGELSVTDGTHSDTREFLTYLEDTDSTTPLSIDTGALPAHGLYEITGWAKLPSGVANTPLNATINNDTSQNYRLFDSSDSPTTGATEWGLTEVSQYRHMPFELTVYSGHEFAEDNNARPGFSFDIKAYSPTYADRGSFAANGATADSVQLTTTNNCLLRAGVVGVTPY